MSQTIEPRSSEHVLVVDGRRIAYDVIGEGQPVFFFHGSPASRLEARLVAAPAAAQGVQLIAPDRPGIGGSDPQSGRRLMDWPPIVEAISRELAIDRFSVIGYSTGALYAYACAHALADRIFSVTVVSGTGTPDLMRGWNAGWLTLLASRTIPGLGNALFGSVAARARRDPAGFQIPGIAPVDRLALNEPATRQLFMQSFTEAFRRGAEGVVEDQVLITRPWGFDPSSIGVPTMLWHGSADRTVPARVAKAMADRIPSGILREVEGEGHISLLAHRADEIFAGLIPRPAGSAAV
jgi:pimeloyl-ACP methyl ester carboxylesterase